MIGALAFIRRIGAGLWGYAAVALAVVLALLLALAKAKKAGKDEVIAQSATKELDNAKQANKIDDEVSAARPDDVRERLSKYSRD